MNSDLISIIIPIYNVEKYIKKCVDSLIKQKYKNIEILLIDDGSQDNSSKICDEYEKMDSRIKVYHKQNGGLSDARNFGIKKSNGKYISLVDGDDFVSENYISNLYMLLTENKADMSLINRYIFNEDTDSMEKFEFYNNYPETEVLTAEEYLEQILKVRLPHEAWAKLYRKEIFKKELYNEEIKVFEDLEFIIRVLDNKNIKIAVNTNMFDYYYCSRDTSIMNEKYNELWDKELEYYLYLLSTDKYDKYKIEITNILTKKCIKNFRKIVEEKKDYNMTRTIQNSSKYIKLKYCEGKKDKIKIFLMKHSPRILWWILKLKSKNRKEDIQ